MPATLLLAPAASGKTEFCIERLRAVQSEQPLAPIRVILPDRNQVSAFKRRLAGRGGAFGVEIGTFQDAYASVLGQAQQFLPLASEALTHRLVRSAIETLAQTNQLPHYAPIADRAGLTLAVADIIGELKRALIQPEAFAAAVSASHPRLRDLVSIYAEYQRALIALNYADTDGMGWLAVQHLEKDSTLAANLQLLIVDGFDSFNEVTLKFLAPLISRVNETLVSLSGDVEMRRTVYHRFAETRKQLERVAQFEIKTLPRFQGYAGPLRHIESALFEANAQKIEPARNVTWIQAQTIRLEAREALRWLKARMVRDEVSADECAIIARDLGPYRPFLREAAAEFGMPLRFLGGEPLAQNPVLIALLNVLELPLTWKRRALLDVLRSPYVDLSPFGFVPADAASLAQVAQYGQVIEGLDQWRQALTRLAEATEQISRDESDPINQLRGDRARALLNALDQFAAWLSTLSTAPLDAYLDWLQTKLIRTDGLHLLQQIKLAPETYARDASALIAFRETLTTLALAAQTTNDVRPLEYAAFLGELRGALNTASYDSDDPATRRQARIYAGNMNTTRGIPYRAAVILGLSEGIFPAPETEDPFLSDADRAALHAQGLQLEPRLRGMQPTLFYEAAARAREFLLLTRPYLADDGETWQSSPYWDATRALFNVSPAPKKRIDQAATLSDASSRAELLQAAAARKELPKELTLFRADWENIQARAEILQARLARETEGIYDGDAGALETLLGARYNAAHEMSPSRLERYGTCGYYFFIASALDLELVEPPTAGFDARQLGTLLHHILEQVYQTARDRNDLTSLLETLQSVAPPILDAAPDTLGFRPTPLWVYERQALLDDLTNTLQALDDKRDDFSPVQFEQHFGGRTAPMLLHTIAGDIRIHGTIDRVDENSAGDLRIIDYKTGSSGFDKDSFIRGAHLQLALYALAAQQLHPNTRVVDGFYWHIRGAKASSFKLGDFYYEDEKGTKFIGPKGAMDFAQAHVGNFVTRIRRGTFTPTPPEDGCPTFCPAKNFCWHYSPRA